MESIILCLTVTEEVYQSFVWHRLTVILLGTVKVHGDISYAPQEPWLFPSTIRENILLGEKYDKARYDEVIRVCALEYDFSLFDERDQTLVADNGQNLSKGQQSRINLARAVYRKCNIYLLDDSLTALDSHVQDFIFNECLLKFLNDKICVLVSQNPKHIDKSVNTIVLVNGMLDYAGDFEYVRKSEIDALSDSSKALPHEREETTDTKDEKTPLLKTEQQQSERSVYFETKKQGKISLNIYRQYLGYGGGMYTLLLIVLLYGVAQIVDSSSDKMLTKW